MLMQPKADAISLRLHAGMAGMLRVAPASYPTISPGVAAEVPTDVKKIDMKLLHRKRR
jgi:hypothetical protein